MTCLAKFSFLIDTQSPNIARPTSFPPAWLSAKWIQPRRSVGQPRISQVFSPDNILSNHFFLTTNAYFAQRLLPLRLPADLLSAILPSKAPRFPASLFLIPRVVLPPLSLPAFRLEAPLPAVPPFVPAFRLEAPMPAVPHSLPADCFFAKTHAVPKRDRGDAAW